MLSNAVFFLIKRETGKKVLVLGKNVLFQINPIHAEIDRRQLQQQQSPIISTGGDSWKGNETPPEPPLPLLFCLAGMPEHSIRTHALCVVSPPSVAPRDCLPQPPPPPRSSGKRDREILASRLPPPIRSITPPLLSGGGGRRPREGVGGARLWRQEKGKAKEGSSQRHFHTLRVTPRMGFADGAQTFMNSRKKNHIDYESDLNSK